MNLAKVALFLEETGLASGPMPVDTDNGEQPSTAFRAINPNGKVAAFVDTDGPGGGPVRLFDSNAILLNLAEKTGQFPGTPEKRPELLSWFFVATSFAPFAGQVVYFPSAASLWRDYAVYQYLEDDLAGRDFILGENYTIVDIAGRGGIDQGGSVLPGADDLLATYSNIKRWSAAIDVRAPVSRARQVNVDRPFKNELGE